MQVSAEMYHAYSAQCLGLRVSVYQMIAVETGCRTRWYLLGRTVGHTLRLKRQQECHNQEYHIPLHEVIMAGVSG